LSRGFECEYRAISRPCWLDAPRGADACELIVYSRGAGWLIPPIRPARSPEGLGVDFVIKRNLLDFPIPYLTAVTNG
jgi:hypothetical protein